MTHTATGERSQARPGSPRAARLGAPLGPLRDGASATTGAPSTNAARSATLAVAGLAAAVSLAGMLAVHTSSRIGAPPFAGRWRLVPPWTGGVAVAAAVAAAVVAGATRTTCVSRI